MEEGNGGQIARATVIDVPMKGQRDLATVTAEIRTLQDAARRVVLSYSVEIGRRLVEAKSMVGHGEWGDYLKDELGFSQSTANNHMRLFEAYGAEQMTLDGAAVKSQAFVNLTYTQALALLALPSEEEREDFVKTHDLGTMSTRELQEELRRRTEADPSTGLEAGPPPLQAGEVSAGDGAAPRPSLQEVEEARETKLRLIRAESRARDAEAERDRIIRETEESREKVAQAEKKAEEAAKRASELQKELDKAKRAEDKAKRELDKAKANKTAPPELLEQLREEAEAAAEARHKADSEELKAAKDQCVKAERDVDAARSEAARAREAAERLEKELKLAAPEMAEFKVRFEGAQEALNRAVDALWALPSDKVDGGVRAVRALLERVEKRLEEERYEAVSPE